MTEPAIHKLEQFTNIIEFIQSIHMIANNGIGQTPAEFDNENDNIFEVIFVMNVHKGNKFLLATYYPTQLQPIIGSSFLVSPCVIPCHKIIPLKTIRAQDDNFSGFNRFVEKVIKNLLITHR